MINTCSYSLIILTCTIIFFSFPSSSIAWGVSGHKIVGWLAEQHLLPEVKDHVDEILHVLDNLDDIDISLMYENIQERQKIKEIADIASWADIYKRTNTKELSEKYDINEKDLLFSFNDQIYSIYNATKSLHFENYIENDRYFCPVTFLQICDNIPSIPKEFPCVRNCITEAIEYYQDELQYGDDQYNIGLALMFLVHHVGDLHQPLHCAYQDDRGGNNAYAFYPNHKKCYKIHRLWDDYLVDDLIGDYRTWKEYARDALLESSKFNFIKTNYLKQDIAVWREESFSFAKDREITQTSIHNGFPYSFLDSSVSLCSNTGKGHDYGAVSI